MGSSVAVITKILPLNEDSPCLGKGLALNKKYFTRHLYNKGTLMGTPKREPQEYSRNTIGIYLPGSLLLLYSWGSLFGVPIKFPLYKVSPKMDTGVAGITNEVLLMVPPQQLQQ